MKANSGHKLLIGVLLLLTVFFASLFIYSQRELLRIAEDKKEEVTYLKKEEAVIIIPKPAIPSDEDSEEVILPVAPVLFEYIQVTDGCGPYFEGECLNARSGPGLDFPVVAKLRNGMVLKVGGEVTREDRKWYKVVFDEWIRYPERSKGDLYIASDYVRVLLDRGIKNLTSEDIKSITKKIVVSRSKQTLQAYEGEELFMEAVISTGVELTPTPRGTFTIFRKTPTRYMQGPLPGISDKYWDLPGVPWNLYFTEHGAVIHGTYWHNNFGERASNGCVNIIPEEAEKLYKWADIGTKVVVQD